MSAPAEATGPNKRISTACEACRASKLRCQPSEQPGVCRKCLESKRECVLRTEPRTRRSRKAKLAQDQANKTAAPPTQPGPSSTFSIDFEIPADLEVDEDFHTLEDSHMTALDLLFPDDVNAATTPPAATMAMADLPTPPASSAQSQPIQDLHTKPRFNRASAESLLAAFHTMLINCPCIVLPADITVSQLAATKPFVLLAILAAASGSKTLQGHMLYDEEFRKVLGLKFVAGGERSLELLQGILIYCAWYPFHLRPKNKQVFHYLRMAADLIHDLELDQESNPDGILSNSTPTETQLEGLRIYLGFHYLSSTAVLTWRTNYRNLTPSVTSFTASCCDVLERHAQADGDLVLIALMRLACTVIDAWEASSSRGQTEQQQRLVLLGLEAQLRSVQSRIPSHISSLTPVKMSMIFSEFYLLACPILKPPRKNRAVNYSPPPPVVKILACVSILRQYLDFLLGLEESAFTHFASVQWANFVMGVIAVVRLSFPLADCPEWDPTWARSQLRLVEFLDAMCEESELTPSSKRVDVVSASRVVLRVVKHKYERRLAALQAQEQVDVSMGLGCPMLDGSVQQYMPLWDADISAVSAMPPQGHPPVQGAQPAFNDLWATMTLGWAGEEAFFPVDENTQDPDEAFA
ncbi:hypothetical protein S40293_01424 [Stachybotrys chartarum IBT 40293]|nr:hypothetical protein S40293_01424 [Stachybotrys chartarum IBT 40293]